MQLSAPAALSDAFAQVSPLSNGAAGTLGPGTFNSRAKVSAAPPALAVSVTVCGELTEEMVAAKLALLAPAGTVTVAGTATDPLLLDKFTGNPLLAAAPFSATVQLSVAAPVSDELAQFSELSEIVGVASIPVPSRPITMLAPFDALLAIVNWPVAAPAAVGENVTFTL